MRNEELEDGELLSALADGQLQGDAFALALARLDASDDALSLWHAYHVAGDVLRRPDLADCRRDRAFVDRLRGRLDAVQRSGQAVAALPTDAMMRVAPVDPGHAVTVSANDAVVRWKWLAGVALVVAVSVSSWHVAQTSGSAQLAQTPATTGVAVAQPGMAEPPAMLRDPRLDELLAAHRQLGGVSALQMSAGFLRNATFEQTGR